MQELGQRMEQLPKGRRENLSRKRFNTCVLCVSAVSWFLFGWTPAGKLPAGKFECFVTGLEGALKIYKNQLIDDSGMQGKIDPVFRLTRREVY